MSGNPQISAKPVRKHLAVVNLYAHAHVEQAENPVHNLHKFKFIELRGGADDVCIALIKLAVAPFLRTVGTPHWLNLEPLEREGEFILVLDHKTRERHSKVVTQPLLTHTVSERAAVVERPFLRVVGG